MAHIMSSSAWRWASRWTSGEPVLVRAWCNASSKGCLTASVGYRLNAERNKWSRMRASDSPSFTASAAYPFASLSFLFNVSPLITCSACAIFGSLDRSPASQMMRFGRPNGPVVLAQLFIQRVPVDYVQRLRDIRLARSLTRIANDALRPPERAQELRLHLHIRQFERARAHRISAELRGHAGHLRHGIQQHLRRQPLHEIARIVFR